MDRTTRTHCSFCGRRKDPFDLVWAKTGTTICGPCVATYFLDLGNCGPQYQVNVEQRHCEIDDLRRAVDRTTEPAALRWTHVCQRPNGGRIVAYARSNTEQRVIVRSTSPWFPEGLPDE